VAAGWAIVGYVGKAQTGKILKKKDTARYRILKLGLSGTKRSRKDPQNSDK
jgi:hypothetical protein